MIDEHEIAADVAEALARSGFDNHYRVERTVDSGSRRNYVLAVRDLIGERTRLWCRTTTRAIDEAFGGRFTLRREAALLERLGPLGISVPLMLGSSTSGRTILQSYIEPAEVPATVAIPAYLAALDGVHALDPWTVFTDPRISGVDETGWLADGDAPDALAERVAAALDVVDSLDPPWLKGDDEMVHGDAGRANFVVDRDDRVWLVDWELAHAGSRLEDYAWCELRGLEEDASIWRREIVHRVLGQTDAYGYFRALIYFRSMLAIAARLAAEPDQPSAEYLWRRFGESEALGWLSAVEIGHTTIGFDPAERFTVAARPRLDAWYEWTRDLHRAKD